MKRLRAKSIGVSAKPLTPSPLGHLSADERALWTHVAASVERISVKARITKRGEATETADTTAPRRPAPHQNRSPESAVSQSAMKAAASTTRRAPAASPDLESRKVKKIGKGRTGIDARLDLHGLRQDEAHMRLRYFLHACQARGMKFVLIITGKGRETDAPAESFGAMLDRPPRGVLRRNLPRWLADPEMRQLIVGYSSALPRHGGDGAYYVELRRDR